MKRRTATWLSAGGVVALLAAAPGALAQHAGKNPGNGRDRNADGNASQAAVDSNGRLRPVTSDEMQELLAGMSRFVSQSADGLSVVRHPSGMLSVDLDDRFQSVSMARLAEDGSVVMRCVGTEPEARHFLGAETRLGAVIPARKAARPASAVALEEK